MSNWLPCDQIANAIAALSPADKAAVCESLNCQPTAAALTAALSSLPGASTPGNVLTISAGGVPTFAAPAAATDTTAGVSALNLGTAAGDATNETDALTAAGLAAILNGTAPNTTPNALQAAVNSNPSQYGTFAGESKPTAAPTPANPATKLVNANGEVFEWNGSAWYLSGNGLKISVSSGVSTFVNDPFNYRVLASFVPPRTGRMFVNSRVGWFLMSNPQNLPNSHRYFQLENLIDFSSATPQPASGNSFSQSVAGTIEVVAGQPVLITMACENGMLANTDTTAVYIN